MRGIGFKATPDELRAMAQQFAFQFGKRTHRLILAATSAGMFMVPGNPRALAKLAHPRRYMDPAYMLRHFEVLYGDERVRVFRSSGGIAVQVPSDWVPPTDGGGAARSEERDLNIEQPRR